MKKFLKRNYLLIVAIIIQSVFYIIAGANKEYIHIDEAYSYGLSNYERTEITDNDDFWNNWHDREYYMDYLSVQDDEMWDYSPVYNNQRDDVHPPLYYLLLRFAMGFSKDHFSKWTGIVLNIIIYAFITIFMYLIINKLLKSEEHRTIKAIALAFMSSITLASVSNVIYIRMYALGTLNILITIFLHIKLLESEKINSKILVCIGFSALAGVLTHYYYLFYLAPLYLILVAKYIKEKRIRELAFYTLTLVAAGVISLIIFPYSINHMFFGYRGRGVIENLKDIKGIFTNFMPNLYNLNYYGFNGLFYLILFLVFATLMYVKLGKKGKIDISKEEKGIVSIIGIPSIIFFIIAGITAPWKVLRYIVPVCSLIFVFAIWILYKLLKIVFNEKIVNSLIVGVFGLVLISPFAFKLIPELMYIDNKGIVKEIENRADIPAIYLYKNGSFLDDIMLFSIINESCILEDSDSAEVNITNIVKEKDLSKRININCK